MFRLIKITFNATLLVLAIIGFNAIGGQKYVEKAKTYIQILFKKEQKKVLESLEIFQIFMMSLK